jgi:hypothetical protein
VDAIRIQGDTAAITAPCTFVSKVKATGKIETASGTCLLTSVYEKDHWLLCDSHFAGSSIVTSIGHGHP